VEAHPDTASSRTLSARLSVCRWLQSGRHLHDAIHWSYLPKELWLTSRTVELNVRTSTRIQQRVLVVVYVRCVKLLNSFSYKTFGAKLQIIQPLIKRGIAVGRARQGLIAPLCTQIISARLWTGYHMGCFSPCHTWVTAARNIAFIARSYIEVIMHRE